ncbi:MAG: hypothetical protein LBC03_05570 [Nitrososphaerota archaeon]|jgi:hypothetical protein|nr:hypothetical protein [Nitrososphaerota archaeon]
MFECSKGHIFIHPATITETFSTPTLNTGKEKSISFFACPKCFENSGQHNLDYVELDELIDEVVKLPYSEAEVNRMLQAGYRTADIPETVCLCKVKLSRRSTKL